MKWLCLFLLLAAVAFTPYSNRRALLFQRNAPAAGGGGSGVVGIASTNTAIFNEAAGVQTQSITVPSGDNRVLLVWVGTGGSAAPRTVDWVSNSVDGILTQILDADDANFVRASVWYKINPTVGASEVKFLADASTAAQFYFNSVVLTNAHQSAPIGATNSVAASASQDPTLDLTSVAATSLGFGFIATDAGTTGQPNGSGVQLYYKNQVSSDTAYCVSTNTGSGTVTFNYNTDENGHAVVAVEIKRVP